MSHILRFLMILLITLSAQATSCPEKSPKVSFDGAEYIFLGQVAEINTDTVTFKVERFWKAALDTNQIILSLHKHPRDLLFEVGQEYIVYVRKEGNGNKTSYCDGTKLKVDASLDLEYLNEHQ